MSQAATPRPAPPRLSAAELRRRWLRMLEDPMLADVPGKLELNENGVIELTRRTLGTRSCKRSSRGRSAMHGRTARLSASAESKRSSACACPMSVGRRPSFMRRYGTTSPLPRAPELCVEILSPTNSVAEMHQKAAAYLAAGAVEVWLVTDEGTLEMRDRHGPLAAGTLGFELGPLPPR